MKLEEQIINFATIEKNFVFLYDAKKTAYSSGKSIFAYDIDEEIKCNSLLDFKKKINKNKKYFGYFSYDLKNEIENLKEDENNNLNNFFKINFASFKNEIDCENLDFRDYYNHQQDFYLANIKQQFTKDEYLNKVSKIKKHIENGEVYQANLTMKFNGEFENETIKYFNLFLKLVANNPVPFAAFIKFDDLVIISASPELFFRVNKINNNRIITTCPIKGTAKLGNELDLKNNKETAENLMITDLMRNDLSRVCVANSVQVENLFSSENFTGYTHLYSEIKGILKNDTSLVDIIFGTFPPASMTGAPKISAMQICSKLEKLKRGIYSGILGYFKGDEIAEFSVIIRTIIAKGKNFEFQVGGGITYDSIPEKEYEEVFIKAKPILDCFKK